MRDDLSGVILLPDRVTAQHNHKTTWNILTTTKSTSPSYRVQLEKSHLPDCMCLKSRVTFIPTNPDWFTSVLDLTLELGFSVAYLSPDRSTHRVPRDLSDPFVKDRHTFHQAFPDICTAPPSSQKAFFHFFATLFRQNWAESC